jgi:DoxX-like family
MTVVTVVVTILAALLFLGAAWVKFIEEERSMQTRDRLGISPGRYRLIGVCEIAGALGAVVGLAVPPLGLVALAGLLLVALGACATQVKLRSPAAEARPAVLAVVLVVGALVLQAMAA